MHQPARNYEEVIEMIHNAMMKYPHMINHVRRNVLEMLPTLQHHIEMMGGRPTQYKIEMFLTNQPYDDIVDEVEEVDEDETYGKKKRSHFKKRNGCKSSLQKKGGRKSIHNKKNRR